MSRFFDSKSSSVISFWPTPFLSVLFGHRGGCDEPADHEPHPAADYRARYEGREEDAI